MCPCGAHRGPWQPCNPARSRLGPASTTRLEMHMKLCMECHPPSDCRRLVRPVRVLVVHLPVLHTKPARRLALMVRKNCRSSLLRWRRRVGQITLRGAVSSMANSMVLPWHPWFCASPVPRIQRCMLGTLHCFNQLLTQQNRAAEAWKCIAFHFLAEENPSFFNPCAALFTMAFGAQSAPLSPLCVRGAQTASQARSHRVAW